MIIKKFRAFESLSFSVINNLEYYRKLPTNNRVGPRLMNMCLDNVTEDWFDIHVRYLFIDDNQFHLCLCPNTGEGDLLFVSEEWRVILDVLKLAKSCSYSHDGFNSSRLLSLIKSKYTDIIVEKSDPKVGTGKKPKGSGRRLYTDENPDDTVSVKFRTLEDVRDTINSPSFKSKSHKRQSQILNLIEQRLRVAHQRAKDPETKKRLKRAHDYIKVKCEKSKEKTKRLKEK